MKKKLNLRQIAHLAGTSKSSVSRVLTNHPHVAARTRERIERVIRDHGFRPNVFARGLAGARTGLVAAITAEMTSGFYAEVLKGIDQVVSERGGHVLSTFAHGPEDYARFWQRMADTRQTDGIILIAPPLELFTTTPHPDDFPIVLCASRPPPDAAPGWERVATATVTNREAMTELLRALHERGIRRIAYLAGPANVYDANERRQAVRDFAREHEDWQVDVVQASHGREVGYEVSLAYLQSRPTPQALVCFNDATAYGALRALRERGLSERDVLVTGCDDEPAAEVMALTTLHMPMPELGQIAGRLLLRQLDQPDPQAPPPHPRVNLQLCWRSA